MMRRPAPTPSAAATVLASPALLAPVARHPLAAATDWVLAFALVEIVCQFLLLFPALGGLRVLLRSGGFAASLALLVFFPRRGNFHPACAPALVALAVVLLSIFHPTTNTFIAGLAQAFLHVAIFAPLLWVPGVHVDGASLRRLVLLLWGWGTLSAFFGVLQVYFPGAFQPNLSSAIIAQGDWYVEDLKITLANGARIFRPMGLTDVPGGAAAGALHAILFSVAILTTERDRRMRLAGLAAMPLGLFCLYLCQVRVTLLMTFICVLVFAGTMALRGELRRVSSILLTIAAVVVVSFAWAVSVGGEAATRRVTGLFESSPASTYYNNRGKFLEETVTVLLPKYPLGAGLARWGMMNFYFGDNSDPERAMIWAEIQWTGWLLDGGVPLVLAYTSALLLALWIAFRCAVDRRVGAVSTFGALVLAYDVGAFAATFNNPLFIGSQGLQFWLLNAVLFAVYRQAVARAVAPSSSRAQPRPAEVAR